MCVCGGWGTAGWGEGAGGHLGGGRGTAGQGEGPVGTLVEEEEDGGRLAGVWGPVGALAEEEEEDGGRLAGVWGPVGALAEEEEEDGGRLAGVWGPVGALAEEEEEDDGGPPALPLAGVWGPVGAMAEEDFWGPVDEGQVCFHRSPVRRKHDIVGSTAMKCYSFKCYAIKKTLDTKYRRSSRK